MKRSRPRPRSQRRIDEAPERDALRGFVLARDRYACQAEKVLVHTCRGPLDVHEVIPRSAWPGGHLVADNCITLCRVAHDWVGNHPNEAHSLGLHGFSWERPC